MVLSRCPSIAFLASLLLIPAACESGFAPAGETAAVKVVLSEAEIEVTDGESRTLKATLLDSRGRSINIARAPHYFEWRVSDPAILEIREAGSEVTINYRTRGTTEVRVTALPAADGSFGSSVVAASNATETLTASAKVKTNQKPARIEEKGGNGQKGRVKTVLPDSLVVRVLDRHGVGVRDERVEFKAVAGGGSPEPVVVMTDSTGYARTTWTLGEVDGEQHMEATASAQVGKLIFVAEALAAPAAVLQASAGDGQSGEVGMSLPNPVQVVVLDEFGNPVPGAAVTWSVVTGGGSIQAAAAQTDAGGHASATWTLGGETGEQQARAAHGDLSALFTATAKGATSTLSSITVSPASVTLDAIGASGQLSATVKDQNGTTLTGSALEWTSSRSETANVDAAGRVTAKAVGTALIIVSTAGLSDTSHVTVRQVPASLQLSSSSLSLNVGETHQLNAVVMDAGGTAISDATVSWSSSAQAVASVSGAGLVEAVSGGSALVSASAEGKTASASVSVGSPVYRWDQRPYTPDSPWNTPIPADAAVDPKSALMIATIQESSNGKLRSDPSQYAYPVYFADSSTPRVVMECSGYAWTIHEDGRRVSAGDRRMIDVPIPPEATPSKGTDAQIIVIDVETGDEYNIWRFAPGSGCENMTRYVKGVYRSAVESAYASRGAGVPYMAGLIRPWEIAQGRIEHALAFAYALPRSTRCVWPAAKTDGKTAREDVIPQGSRLRLDPAVDVDRIPGLDRTGRIIARALQEYGAYVIDTGGANKLYAEDSLTAEWGTVLTVTTVSAIPVDRLQVLRLPDAYWAPEYAPSYGKCVR